MVNLSHGLLVLLSSACAWANTESIVFNAGEVQLSNSLGPNSLVLGQKNSWAVPLPLTGASISTARLSSAPPKLGQLSAWLDRIEHKFAIAKRTLRVSWPASSPADFTFSISKDFILIIANPSAVPIPRPSSRLSTAGGSQAELTFDVLLEPVHFGFLPDSCLPLIAVILGVLVALRAGNVPGRVWRAVEGVADGAGEVAKGKGAKD